jgi:hypothetical protein
MIRGLFLLAVLSAPDGLHAIEAKERAPVPVRVTDDFTSVAERFGVPTAFGLLLWGFIVMQQRRRDRREDEEAKRRQKREDEIAQHREEREDKVLNHLVTMDERRASQMEHWGRIQEQQSASMHESCKTAGRLEETVAKIADVVAVKNAEGGLA